MLYLASDHRGFALKEKIKQHLQQKGVAFKDLGNNKLDNQDDYPIFASKVAQNVSKNPDENLGIILCGSGVGVDIVANKFEGIRSGLAINSEQIKAAKKDDHINVLSLAADFINLDEAIKIIDIFLVTEPSNEERYLRRLQQIEEIES